ncbi:MAG: RNA methyltransferase [Bacteroidetes bacterium]|nr:RNA methyltransferase [Bacteroidota bacterium]
MRLKSMNELNRPPVEQSKNNPKIPVVAVLPNLRSLQNVGSIFRSADAFGLKEIILCGYTGRPPHRDIHKAALGAEESVSWRAWDDPLEALGQLQSEGYTLVAVEQAEPSHSLADWSWEGREPLALVFGNEMDGLDPALLQACDWALELPQWGCKHSLNVSVCAGILFWEAARRAMPNRT